MRAKKSNRVTEFAGTGKLTGAEARVFEAAAMRLVDATRDACSDTPDETPLYSRLTPHHRIELLADVVVGLLDPTVPLPKDDPEHQSAYLAVWGTVMCEVTMEIDMDRGKAHAELEKKNKKKLEKKLKKDEEMEAAGGAKGASSSRWHDKESRHVKSTMSQMDGISRSGSLSFQHDVTKRSADELMKMAEKKSNSSRFWRLLLLAAFEERY